MSFRLFGLAWNSRWKTLSIYEKFEQLIVSILTWIIAVIVAVATWQLILHTVGMIRRATCSIQRTRRPFNLCSAWF